MSMTRKDLARNQVANFREPCAATVFSFTENAIAKTLGDDNPRFDRERFLMACRKGEAQS